MSNSATFLLVENLTIFSSVKHEAIVLDKNIIYTFEDIKPKDLVSIKFRYDDKSYYAFRVDLLKALYNPRQSITSNVGLPGQTIFNFKTNKTNKVLRLIDDNMLLDDQSLLDKYSLDYAVLELDEMSLGSNNYQVSPGVNAFSSVKIVRDEGIPELIEILSNFDKLAFDTETTGLTQKLYTLDDKEDFVVAATISTDANSGYYIRNTKSDNFRLLMAFLGSKHLIMHNATFDLTVLKVVYGIEPKSFDDTLVMAKLMNENLLSYSLKTLTDQILKRGKQLKLDDFDYLTYVDSNRLHYIDYVLAFYATADTANTFGLYNYTQPKLKSDSKLYAYYTGIELPSIIPVAVAINENGLTVDIEALNQIKVDAEKYVVDLLDKMAAISKPYIDKINQEFLVEQQEAREEYADQAVAHFRGTGAIKTDADENITRNLINLVQYDQLPAYGSLKKLAAFHNKLVKRPQGDVSYTLDLSNTEMMEKLVYSSKHGFNLPLQKSATGKPSFNKKAISELQKYIFEQGIDVQVKEFFEAFTEHTKTRKLLDAFVYPTLESIKDSKDGKLHPSYNLLGTVSSRASCSNPNFQQLANNKRFDLRKCFVVEDKSKYSFLQFDFEAQELYVMAVLSEDPILLDIIKQGKDAHAATVRKVWPQLAHLTDQEIKEQHKSKRDIAKVVMFSLAYGARAKKMAFILDIPIKEAERVLSTFKSDVYPTLSKWLDDAAVEIKKYGEVDIVGGYRRRFKSSGNNFTDQGILRSIVNSLIQGASAYITKICTLRILAALHAAGIAFKLVILIHDSITIQVEDKDIKRAYDIVDNSMKFVMHGVTLRSEGAINKDMSKLTEQKITDLFEDDE